ncbi:hypothetical protein BGZ95_006613, partial [Linnemannia exigua]
MEDHASSFVGIGVHLHNQGDTKNENTQLNSHQSLADQYKQVILKTCMSAYKSTVNDLAKITFSYLKDDRLGRCHMIENSGRVDNLPEGSFMSSDTMGRLERMIPDPELKDPEIQCMVREIIRRFQDRSTTFPCEATAASHLSSLCKILKETLSMVHTIPMLTSQDVVSTDEKLAAVFMRSTKGGPLDCLSFDGCHYKWASQYQAAKRLSGLGKDANAISMRTEAVKSFEAMHSAACIYLLLSTDRTLHDDPVLRQKLHALGGLAYLSDVEWKEDQETDRDGYEQLIMAVEHCRFSNGVLNAGFGYEKICEVQRQKQRELIQPAWLCSIESEERQRILLSDSYGDYGVNCESPHDLMEDEGRRARGRLRCMILGCNVDCYDEWTSGELNVSSTLCPTCFTTEVRAVCAVDLWDSEDYDFYDRWVYAAQAYFIFSARHYFTLARFLRFKANDVEDNLAKYNQVSEMVLKGKKNSELLEAIASAVGVLIHDDELSDRIARQYDWFKISGMCSRCNQDGAAANEWYLATFGASLGSQQLTLLEKVRLAHYLDSTGWNVFPALHRSYLSGCGCVGRWIKRCYMLMIRTSDLWKPSDYSSAFALRDAVAGSIEELDESAIVALLQDTSKE